MVTCPTLSAVLRGFRAAGSTVIRPGLCRFILFIPGCSWPASILWFRAIAWALCIMLHRGNNALLRPGRNPAGPASLPTSSPSLVHHVPWTVRDILRSLIECYLWAQKTFSFVFSSFFSVTEGRIVCILIGCIRVCVFELGCICVCTHTHTHVHRRSLICRKSHGFVQYFYGQYNQCRENGSQSLFCRELPEDKFHGVCPLQMKTVKQVESLF